MILQVCSDCSITSSYSVPIVETGQQQQRGAADEKIGRKWLWSEHGMILDLRFLIADLRLPIADCLPRLMNSSSLVPSQEEHDSPAVRKTSNRQSAIGNWQSKIKNRKLQGFPAKFYKQWCHRFDNLIVRQTVACNQAISVLYLGYVVVQGSAE